MKKINVQVGNGFQMGKPWISISKTIYAMTWTEFKNEKSTTVFYGTPPLSIQTHGKNIKKKQKN